MTYAPREGSLTDKVIGTLDHSPPGTVLTAGMIALRFNVPGRTVSNTLKSAVAAGLLFRTSTHAGAAAWGLGPADGFSA